MENLSTNIIATILTFFVQIQIRCGINIYNAIGRIFRMDTIINKGVEEASLTYAENKLKSLKRAFSNFSSPDFGICIQFGDPIPVGRMLIMPETHLCVHCAQ